MLKMAVKKTNDVLTIDILNKFEKCIAQNHRQSDLGSPQTVFVQFLRNASKQRDLAIRRAKSKLSETKQYLRQCENQLSKLSSRKKRLRNINERLANNLSSLAAKAKTAEHNYEALVDCNDYMAVIREALIKEIAELNETISQKRDMIEELQTASSRTRNQCDDLKNQILAQVRKTLELDDQNLMMQRSLEIVRWIVVGTLNDMQFVTMNEFMQKFVESLENGKDEEQATEGQQVDATETQPSEPEEDPTASHVAEAPWNRLKRVWNEGGRFLLEKARSYLGRPSTTNPDDSSNL